MSEPTKYRSGPLQRIVPLGDDIGDFIVRLYWKPIEDGCVLWVYFETFEIIGFDVDENGKRGRQFYNLKGSHRTPDPVYTLDEAEVQSDGFVKSDGCTQFDVGRVHVDHHKQLSKVFASIWAARRLAAEAMPGSDIHIEYKR